MSGDLANLYADEVIQGLTLDDMRLLGVLKDQDATSGVKAMVWANLQTAAGLTDAKFRKALTRMEAAQLIKRVAGIEPFKVFLSNWGSYAVAKAIQ